MKYTVAYTFASLVDEAVERAQEQAAPFIPSRAQYETAMNFVLLFLGDCSDPWAFMKATHRGAGTMDAVASELFKRTVAKSGLIDGYNAEFLGAKPARAGEDY